jgi:hypothetical protein
MLRALVMATAVLGLAACGGDRPRTSGTPCTVTRTCGSNSPVLPGPTINPAGPSDPSDPSDPAVVDFAHPSGSFDFGTSKYGCAGFTQCYIDCFNTNPSASSATCTSTCQAQSKSTASSTFQSALACGQSYCLGSSGSGYKCKLDSSGTSIVNMDGTPISDTDPTTGSSGTKDCGQCLNDALAKLFGDACVTSTADCSNNFSGAEVTACGSSTNACLSDLP